GRPVRARSCAPAQELIGSCAPSRCRRPTLERRSLASVTAGASVTRRRAPRAPPMRTSSTAFPTSSGPGGDRTLYPRIKSPPEHRPQSVYKQVRGLVLLPEARRTPSRCCQRCCQEVFETSRHLFLGDGVPRSPSHTCARLSSTLDWNVEWLAGQQAADELLDAGTDLVAHRADFRDALAGWVLGFPVLVPLAGVVGAGVDASHGDDHVGGLDGFGVRTFGFWWEISMPTSAMASTAAGLIESAGADPAERTAMRSPASSLSHPAAIWDRPALWTQTNKTLGRAV